MSSVVPEGWGKTNLGDITTIIMGQSPSSDTYNTESDGLPFFQGKTDFGNHHPSVRIWCSEPTKVAPPYSILFSVRAPVGDVNVTKNECCIGRGLSAIVGNGVDQSFLYQNLIFSKSKFQVLAQGSTFEAINGSELKEFSVLLPPKPEQQKIASILTSVDDVIEKTESQISKLQDLKNGMMQELLTKGIDHTEFKDSPVGRIPVGWDILTLSDKSEHITKGSTPTTYGYNWVEKGILFLRSECIKKNVFSLQGAMNISQDAHNTLARSKIKGGDILITITGYIGHACIFPMHYKEANINQHIAKIRIKDSILKQYIVQYLNSEKQNRAFLNIQTGQAYPQLSLKQIQDTIIPYPMDKMELNKIVSILTVVDNNIENKQRKLQQNKSLKKSLMQDLLTGKVRVKTD